MQALKNNINDIDIILLTHPHADHIMGIAEMRNISRLQKKIIDMYGQEEHLDTIAEIFNYIDFNINEMPQYIHSPLIKRHDILTNGSYITKLKDKGVNIRCYQQPHGPNMNTTSFTINDNQLVYIPDFNELHQERREDLKNLEINTLIVAASIIKQHRNHMNIYEVLDLIQEIKPKRSYLVHMGETVDHDTYTKVINERFPDKSVQLTWDGFKITI